MRDSRAARSFAGKNAARAARRRSSARVETGDAAWSAKHG